MTLRLLLCVERRFGSRGDNFYETSGRKFQAMMVLLNVDRSGLPFPVYTYISVLKEHFFSCFSCFAKIIWCFSCNHCRLNLGRIVQITHKSVHLIRKSLSVYDLYSSVSKF